MVYFDHGYIVCNKCKKTLDTTKKVEVYANILLENHTPAEYLRTVIYTIPVAQSLINKGSNEMEIAKELHDILEKNPPKVTVEIKTKDGKVYNDINDLKIIKIETTRVVETFSAYCPRCKNKLETDSMVSI